MAERGFKGILVRVYRAADRPQVESFCCLPEYGLKWSEAAEQIIREAPSVCEGDGISPVIAVAVDGELVDGNLVIGDELVGVVVFGFEVEAPSLLVIYSLGVRKDRQQEGIGTPEKGRDGGGGIGGKRNRNGRRVPRA